MREKRAVIFGLAVALLLLATVAASEGRTTLAKGSFAAGQPPAPTITAIIPTVGPVVTLTPTAPGASPTLLAPTALPDRTAGTPLPRQTPAGPVTGLPQRNLLAQLRQFDNYTVQTDVRWDLEDGTGGTAEVTTTVQVRPPSAQRWEIDIRPEGGTQRTITAIRVGGQTYVQLAGMWQDVPPATSLILRRVRWLGDPTEFIDLTMGRRVREIEVNGMDTVLYRYGYRAFAPAMEHIDVENAQADVYVSTEYNVPVRVSVHMLGSDALENIGTFDITMELVEIDGDVNIEDPTTESTGVTGRDPLVVADALGLEQYGSFTTLTTVDWQTESAGSGTAMVDTQYNDTIPAERARALIVTSELPFTQQFEYLNVDGTAYRRAAGGDWRPASTAAEAIVEQIGWIGRPQLYLRPDAGEIVEEGVMFRGKEVTRYRFGTDAFDALALLGTIDEAEAEVWYAPEDDAYLRIIISASGVDANGDLALYNVESNVRNINEGVLIDIPRELSVSPNR